MKSWQLVTAAALGWLGFQYYQKGDSLSVNDMIPDVLNSDLPTKPTKVYTPKLTPTTGGAGSYPLRRGSRGDLVRLLQAQLGTKADGIFGPATETALYQRFGVKEVTSDAQMKALFRSGVVVPTPAPSAPKPAPSKVATPVPVKPAVPKPVAKKPAPAKPVPAKPVAPKPVAPKPAAPVAPKPVPAKSPAVPETELNKVFGAFWDARSTSYRNLKSTIDTNAVKAVLEKKSDAALKLFIQSYNAKFRASTFVRGGKPERPVPTLKADLAQLSSIRRNYDTAYTALEKRVQKLS